jgi:hypothetical protein
MHIMEDDRKFTLPFPFQRIGDLRWTKYIANNFSCGCIGSQMASAAVAGGVTKTHAFDAARIVCGDSHSFDGHGNFWVSG